jgi:hypothetical protein
VSQWTGEEEEPSDENPAKNICMSFGGDKFVINSNSSPASEPFERSHCTAKAFWSKLFLFFTYFIIWRLPPGSAYARPLKHGMFPLRVIMLCFPFCKTVDPEEASRSSYPVFLTSFFFEHSSL